MAKLHYYGSVFDLANDLDDDTWRESIASYRRLAEEHGHVFMTLRLVDQREVTIRLTPDTAIALVHEP